MDAGPGKTLLLVEDEFLLAMNEKAQLQKYGYQVITAPSGEKAVEAVSASEAIDLILMDINLGRGIDGTRAAELILRDHDIPIVFLSSHMEKEVVEKTEAITSYGYVVKNSSITVLDASIKMAFKLFDAHRGLTLANSRLAATLDALPDLLFEVGLDGYYYDVHSHQTELLARPAAELVGRKIPEVLPPEVAAVIMAAIREAHEKGYSTGRQYEIAVPAGLRCFEVSICRIASYPDNPHFIFLARDITGRKSVERRLHESETRYRSLIEHSSNIIFAVDRDGRYQIANEAFARSFGRSVGELTGRTFWDLSPKEDADRRSELVNRVFDTGQDIRFEITVPLGDRRLLYSSVANPIRDEAGAVVLVMVNGTDITERKRAEERVLALLEEKERLLGENHGHPRERIVPARGLTSPIC